VNELTEYSTNSRHYFISQSENAVLAKTFSCFRYKIIVKRCINSRDGKEPSLLEFGSVRVLPNIRVRSVRVLSSYGKMKVRFWFGSLCSLRFCSVRFYAGSYPYLPSLHVYYLHRIHSVSQKKSTRGFHIFPNSWEFLVTYLLFFIYARLQIFIQFSPTVMKSCHIKCDHPACMRIDRWWTFWAWCELGGRV